MKESFKIGQVKECRTQLVNYPTLFSPVSSKTVKEVIINFTPKMQIKYMEQQLRATFSFEFRNQTRSFLFYIYEARKGRIWAPSVTCWRQVLE